MSSWRKRICAAASSGSASPISSRHQARTASIRTVANQPIAQEFYDTVLRPAWQRLADRFASMMKEGRLKFADPWITAMHWKGLNEWDMLEKHLLSAKHAAIRMTS